MYIYYNIFERKLVYPFCVATKQEICGVERTA